MKNILLACLVCIGLIGCEGNYKHTTSSVDGTVDINGKKCEIIVIERHGGGYLYYVDCPTGSSVMHHSGKNSTTTMVTSKPEATQTGDATSCPMPPKPCGCQ